jgi:N-acetylglucosaminyldiphosphoundecaprenol N-acetyl-beta-D-mannosaminyltransferase
MDKLAACLEQPVYWLLGLPFDAVDLEQAIVRIDAAVAARDRLIFATPNVNFIAMAARRAEFREDVLRTNLSLVDGMPLVWIGRILGIPFRQRVAGSTLVERLLARDRSSRVRLYLFGGEPGAAEAAGRRINALNGGVEAVGALCPGFGGSEDLSATEAIAGINRSSADFLLVSLGAEKGHAWIERNRAALAVPVISHLGATLNFYAGTIRRAPRILQRLGLEWLWRIGQEPRLLSRYARDGVFMLRECIVVVAPELCRRLFGRRRLSPFRCGRAVDVPATLRLEGSLLASDLETLHGEVREISADGPEGIYLDLSALDGLDSRALGFLYQLRYRGCLPCTVTLTGSGAKLERLLRRFRAEMLLSVTAGRGSA